MRLKKVNIKAVLLAVILLTVAIVSGGCRNEEPPAPSNQAYKLLFSSNLDASKSGILIGIEYAMPGMAKDFTALGVPAVKYYPDGFSWGKTQVSKGAPINFYSLDRYVKEYQDAGYKELIIALKSMSAWASKNIITNYSPKPEQYPAAFNEVDKRVMKHSLSDIRKILDRPDIFDAIDFHALGDPYEIEDTVNWLKYEMKLRGYTKRIVIGDTAISPLVGWGAATLSKGTPSQIGIIVSPAVEKDRSRLVKFFQSLVDGDKSAVEWTQSFAACDMVEKVVISAEQGVALINTAFMEEYDLFKLKSFLASAGASAWGGMALTKIDAFNQERTIVKFHPLFYALKQLVQHINGYSSIERVTVSNSRIRLYKVVKNNKTFWIAWLDPGKLVLPNDAVPQKLLSFKANSTNITVESMINKPGQTAPVRRTIKTKNGIMEITITPTPVFIFDSAQKTAFREM